MTVRRRTLAVFAVAALALGGCGSDARSGAEAPPAPPSEPPASPERPKQCPQPWFGNGVDRQLDSRELVGLTLAAARAEAAEYGCDVRVERRDGRDLAVTEDLRPDRIGVTVEDGSVTAVSGVG